MTKRETFTQAKIQRVISACKKAGMLVGGVEVDSNGTIRVLAKEVDVTPSPSAGFGGPKPWPK